jgi:hypothetical protein
MPQHFTLALLLVLLFAVPPLQARSTEFSRVASDPINQALEGAVFGLAQDIKDFLEADRLLRGQKIRLDRVSSDGLPDSNYDQFFEQALSKHLETVLADRAALLLKVEYSYVVSDTEANRGNRILQIHAKLSERGMTKKTFLREVNNTSDISRVLGNTQQPLDSKVFPERLKAVEASFEAPSFQIVESTQVAAPANAKYTVELRRRVGGRGEALPVKTQDEFGLAFAPLDISDTYEIVLSNYDTAADAVAKIDIDGLDAISTFCIDRDSQGELIQYPGYFIPRATNAGPGRHVVSGWLHTVERGDKNVFEFVVNELGKGAASARQVRGKTGVITVRFFDSYRAGEQPRGRNFGETGQGQPRKQDYDLIEVNLGSEPVSQVTVRYSRNPEGQGSK